MLNWIDLSLVSKRNSQVVVVAPTFHPSTVKSHAFNPRTRKGETGMVVVGQRGEYKAGGDRSSLLSVCGFLETGSCLLWSEDSVEEKGLSSREFR